MGAELRLSSKVALEYRDVYLIVIQDSHNVTKITKSAFLDEPLAETTKGGLLSCDEMRYFWVSWGDTIALGKKRLN